MIQQQQLSLSLVSSSPQLLSKQLLPSLHETSGVGNVPQIQTSAIINSPPPPEPSKRRQRWKLLEQARGATDRFDRIFCHDRSPIETLLVDVPPPFLLAITMAFLAESKADANVALDCCRGQEVGPHPRLHH